jgi:hypothetical protein
MGWAHETHNSNEYQAWDGHMKLAAPTGMREWMLNTPPGAKGGCRVALAAALWMGMSELTQKCCERRSDKHGKNGCDHARTAC